MTEREPLQEKNLLPKKKKQRKQKDPSVPRRSESNLPEQIISQLEEAELRGKGKFPD